MTSAWNVTLPAQFTRFSAMESPFVVKDNIAASGRRVGGGGMRWRRLTRSAVWPTWSFAAAAYPREVQVIRQPDVRESVPGSFVPGIEHQPEWLFAPQLIQVMVRGGRDRPRSGLLAGVGAS